MNLLVSKKVTTGFGLALIILTINSVLSFQNILKLIEANSSVAHTLEVLSEVESVLSDLTNAETGQRGYILTGKEAYLEPYDAAIETIPPTVQHLRQLTSDNPNQQQQLDILTSLITEKLNYLRQAIEIRQNQGFEAAQAMVLTGQGKQTMDNIRQVIVEMTGEERKLLERRSQAARTSGQITLLTFSIAAFVGMGLIFLAYFLVNHDLTERQQAEETLRESEAKFRLMFAHNPLPMWVYDRETFQFLAVNDAAVNHYGFSREEFLQMSISDIQPGEDKTRWLEQVAEDHPNLHYSGQWRHHRKNGQIIEVEIISHILDFDGRKAALVVAIDITERKHLEEQLNQSQKMEAVGRLAGGVAHDFNNLLTVIAGYCELLLDRHLNKSNSLRRYVEEINKASDSASALARQLLVFSRKQVLQPEVLDLNGVITEIGKMLQRLIGEDIDLVTIPGKALGLVKADPGQIEQVIMNLAVNARDAMPQGGKLTIETANVELDERYARQHTEVTPGPHVMLAVSDTGTGMDKEVLAHLYEPFFTTKEKGKGTGLGLATVYGVVKQSGGHIWVYSEVGRGTIFKIYLPRLEATGEIVEPGHPQAKLPQGSETILLVEDEAGVRELIFEVLTRRGYTVLEASDGNEALQLASQHPNPIHLLLTDVVIPGGMNGREVAERLTGMLPELKVLYMSGYTDEAIVHHGVLDRDTIFLQKPFTPDTLERKVREVLNMEVNN